MLPYRLFHTSVRAFQATRTVPPPSQTVPDVAKFLSIIGRDCNEFAEVYGNKWDNLFHWDTTTLKEKGIPPQKRKYILAQVERYRAGAPIQEFKQGKKSFFGGERNRKAFKAKWNAEQRNKLK